MTISESLQRAAASVALRPFLNFIAKNPSGNLVKLVNLADRLSGHAFPQKTITQFKAGAQDPQNTWMKLAGSILEDVDRDALRRLLLSLGLGIVNGTKLVRKNREKYNCNIPFQILFDPTSACNMHCKGCWAGEYQKHDNLTYEEMDSIVCQGKKLGTRVYMLTGGEPLVRKKDILRLAAAHKESTFLIYTNATLIDRDLCKQTKKLGNVIFAISLEGWEESNDARRGDGAYARSMQAIDLLCEERCLFGISICYTSQNLPVVTSDAFLENMIAKGAKFAFMFNYMPIGQHAVVDLIPTPEQREELYHWLRKTRNSKTGKPIFIMDFQNDGEYVGGCIGGGRNYFHINAAGDMEPCVFIHFSDSNIRKHTLLEALQRPLFQAYYHGQPFNDNHLRPCPMLENPQLLRSMVRDSNAVSTDLAAPESADELCARCEHYAKHWAPVAQRVWEDNPHPHPKTQYYRDTQDTQSAFSEENL
ncbi:MAG: radical SAM protein [Oscillospiraceae bacterium]|jgi:MoaA/NifB/PqqE/SkfB family radical SAM enzyme|nr:radical SAM protein [Oscillospiraceae bacterium]